MKQLVENVFAVIALMGAEAWFLHGYFAGQPEFEPALLTLACIGVVLAKDPLNGRSARKTREHDRALLRDLQLALPVDPTIRVLKEHDFGDAVRKRDIESLFDFAARWGSVDKEFLEATLEKKRKLLYLQAEDLVNEIARRTVPVRGEGYISVWPDSARESGLPRTDHVREDARILNEKATSFAETYDLFIREWKQTLEL